MFKFRQLMAKDFPQMLEWLQKEHVKKWWNDGDDTFEKVALHYGEKSKDVERFILVEVSRKIEKPIGYFQFYFALENQIGIDQFIGDENYLNRGVGEQTIKLFIEMIKRRHQPNFIILDPSPENTRAIRCYEKVGFKHFETKQTEQGDRVYLMRYEI